MATASTLGARCGDEAVECAADGVAAVECVVTTQGLGDIAGPDRLAARVGENGHDLLGQASGSTSDYLLRSVRVPRRGLTAPFIRTSWAGFHVNSGAGTSGFARAMSRPFAWIRRDLEHMAGARRCW